MHDTISRHWLGKHTSPWQCSACHVCQETSLATLLPLARKCGAVLVVCDWRTPRQAHKHQRPPRRVAVFTIRYAYGAAPSGVYTILALERQPALLLTTEPPEMRRSVTVDISVASSQERSCSASLHAPPLPGSTGPPKTMPSIARGPEIGQAVRFLPARAATRGSRPVEICEAF